MNLKYGRTIIPFEYDDARFAVLGSDASLRPLSDAEMGARLDVTIDSAPLDDMVSAGQRVLLVIPDATRQTGAGQIVNLVVRRLIANGSTPADINIIFATGIHRPVTEAEKRTILGDFIVQRLKTLDHNSDDAVKNFRVGETSGGIPVELNWLLTEFDHIVLVGGITFHYFAGFTGGRKLICPGLASARTIKATHKLAFDCEQRDRRAGVGTGLLDGNPVHEAFVEAAAFAKPSFAINTIVDDAGRVVELFCGDWIASHRLACDSYAAKHTVTIKEKHDLVIASCGGYPFDINMIQAHKALEAAAQACTDGGTIIFLAECADGLGRRDFLDWFTAETSDALAERLCEKYQVNGQTAWSLLRKAERFDIRIITSLDKETVTQMRLRPCASLDIALSDLSSTSSAYLLPFGTKILPRADD